MIKKILLVFFVALAGCSGFGRFNKDGGAQGVTVAPLPESKAVEISVKREELINRLKNGSVNKIRVISTYSRSSEQSNSYPRYRLFDIDPTGPYALLGLRDADILIAAHDYVVFDPRSFSTYVTLLTNEDRTSIQILRGGEALVLDVKIK
jgi:hypothetical protein